MRRVLLALLLFPVAAYAQTRFTPDEINAAAVSPAYFAIETIELTEILANGRGGREAAGVGPSDKKPHSTAFGGPPRPQGEDLGAIINLGKQVWDIIVANKPVVDVKTSFASAMPAGVSRAEQLERWSAPEATFYELRARNLYKQDVVYLRFAVVRTTGGRYKGKGRYLTAATVHPFDLHVLWGYRFNVSAEAVSTTNVGTAADPIAALMLALNYRIETPLKETRGSGLYHVQGDGKFKDVGRPAPPAVDLSRFGSF